VPSPLGPGSCLAAARRLPWAIVIATEKMADDVKLPKYEGNPKHKHPWQPGRRGSLCPKEIDVERAQELLAASVEIGAVRFATQGGRAFCAREHRAGAWHGYPVGWREVPPKIRGEWLSAGLIARRDVKENW